MLSRTRIYEHVWDEQYDGLSNTLEVHVMELRRKLEAHGPRLIHTLRGRGYVFGAPRRGQRHEPRLPRSRPCFLVALGLVLARFSAALYVLGRAYLDRQVDERLEAALDTAGGGGRGPPRRRGVGAPGAVLTLGPGARGEQSAGGCATTAAGWSTARGTWAPPPDRRTGRPAPAARAAAPGLIDRRGRAWRVARRRIVPAAAPAAGSDVAADGR